MYYMKLIFSNPVCTTFMFTLLNDLVIVYQSFNFNFKTSVIVILIYDLQMVVLKITVNQQISKIINYDVTYKYKIYKIKFNLIISRTTQLGTNAN